MMMMMMMSYGERLTPAVWRQAGLDAAQIEAERTNTEKKKKWYQRKDKDNDKAGPVVMTVDNKPEKKIKWFGRSRSSSTTSSSPPLLRRDLSVTVPNPNHRADGDAAPARARAAPRHS